jgi:tetratricopeptide (TPR) repeat protein
MATSLNNLGILVRNLGDLSAARAYYDEGLSISRELGNRGRIAMLLNNLGCMDQFMGDYEAARLRFEEGLSIFRELGDQRGIATSFHNLGDVASYHRDHSTARACYQESLSINREREDPQGIAEDLAALGIVAADLDEPILAARLLSSAGALMAQLDGAMEPDQRERTDEARSSVNTRLGDVGFAKEWSVGQAMPIEQAIRYALANFKSTG